MDKLKKSLEIFLIVLFGLVLTSMISIENFFMQAPLISVGVAFGVALIDYVFRVLPRSTGNKVLSSQQTDESKPFPWSGFLKELLKYFAAVVILLFLFNLLRGTNYCEQVPVVQWIILLVLCVLCSAARVFSVRNSIVR